MKVPHHYCQKIIIFVEWLKNIYEVEVLNKLKSTRGKVHGFLGMTLDFSKPVKVAVDIKNMLNGLLNIFQLI